MESARLAPSSTPNLYHHHIHLFRLPNTTSLHFSTPRTIYRINALTFRFNPTRNTKPLRKQNQFVINCVKRTEEKEVGMKTQQPEPSVDLEVDCIGTGREAECFISETNGAVTDKGDGMGAEWSFLARLVETGVLISPFFFWGTAMVAMKEVLPLAGPFFVAAFRLIPAGMLLVGFAGSQGRRLPSGLAAWLSIALFGLVDATCFQGFLAEGLQRTSAGLGSLGAVSNIGRSDKAVSLEAGMVFGTILLNLLS